MNNILPQLICAHLVGDFALQNHWMANNKASDGAVCFIHVMVYGIPMTLVLLVNGHLGLTPCFVLWLIQLQHFLQDRYQLHLKWMKFYRQTEPERWPTGPLCVDQAWHIAFLWLFSRML